MATKRKSEDVVKHNCPTCHGERSCYVHGRVKKPWNDQYEGMSGLEEYMLLECRGCETVFYLNESSDSESFEPDVDAYGNSHYVAIVRTTTFPTPDNRPQWLGEIPTKDRQLHQILDETYGAFEARSFILTAVGLRTAFDRATELLNIDPNLSFKEKLQALKDGGFVGDTEMAILEIIIDAGSAAAHRAWSPRKAETEKMMMAIEAFLHRAFIVGNDAMSIKARIPQKPKRKKISKNSAHAQLPKP